MTIGIEDLDAARVEQRLMNALTALGAAGDCLRISVAGLDADGGDPGAVVKDLRALTNALTLAIDLETKARAKRAKDQGDTLRGRFDLDAARAEIGCRLDCLRTARSGR